MMTRNIPMTHRWVLSIWIVVTAQSSCEQMPPYRVCIQICRSMDTCSVLKSVKRYEDICRCMRNPPEEHVATNESSTCGLNWYETQYSQKGNVENHIKLQSAQTGVKSTQPSVIDQCQSVNGFELLTEHGPCVKFHADKMTWNSADQKCQAYSPNGRLAVLDNQEKNEHVKAKGMAINTAMGFSYGLWIGLREDTQNVFKWVDGENIVFTAWSSYDESSASTEDCGYLSRSHQWTWAKTRCTKIFHYLCEIELNR